MRHLLLALALLPLAPSCSTLGGEEAHRTLLSTRDVVVSGDVRIGDDGWTLRNLVAEVPAASSARLVSLVVVGFSDLDGDDLVGEWESCGTTRVSSTSGERRLAAVGRLHLGSLEGFDPSVWKLDVRVNYAGGEPSEEASVVPFVAE